MGMRATAEGYRRCHQDPQIEVVPFATDTIATAVRFYEARGDKDWSLTDCLSFLVMEQRRVPCARQRIATSNKQVSRQYCLETHPELVEFLLLQ